MNKFFETFNIKKLKFKTSAREEDENGNICAWYEEEVYPYPDGELFLKLLAFSSNKNENELINDVLNKIQDNYTYLKNNNSELAEQYKQQLEEIINDYVNERNELYEENFND